MTTNSKVERFTEAWFKRKVAQLGAALRGLPPHRCDLAPLEDPQSKTGINTLPALPLSRLD